MEGEVLPRGRDLFSQWSLVPPSGLLRIPAMGSMSFLMVETHGFPLPLFCKSVCGMWSGQVDLGVSGGIGKQGLVLCMRRDWDMGIGIWDRRMELPVVGGGVNWQ